MNDPKTLYIVVNVDTFFLSHRLAVALGAKHAGWDVTIVTADTGKFGKILEHDLKVIDLPMSRSGINAFQEIKAFYFLYSLYKNNRPCIVHHVGMKSILWGSLAAKFNNINGVVNAISGLGSFFAEENKSLMTRIVTRILRFSHNRNKLLCIFQNNDDLKEYIDSRIIDSSKARFIKGSGIDLNEFKYVPEPTEGKIKVILTARMIVEKGIFVFTQAAEILRPKYEEKLEFQLVGGLDDHPNPITTQQLDDVCDGRYIKWLGYREDINDLLQNSHIYVLPSYYKEGLPKSLIEACAVGRPIVTCDSVGCKDAVVDGVNGYLVPIKDPETLAEKIEELVNHPELRVAMGKEGRKMAEQFFNIDSVIEKHLNIYSELI